MSSGQNDQTPPITRAPAPVASPPPPPAGVSRGALIGIGVAVVVLSFVAAFLGSWLARSADNEVAPTPTAESTPSAEPSETASPDYEAIIEDLLPAGSAVRAGTGAPESGKGYEGDVYIDRTNSDVYVFQDDWVWVGNIKANAAANLTGETGPAGTPGAPGAPGAPGTAGTQVLLGVGAPAQQTCQTDGDVYIDTSVNQYYQCSGGTWTLFGPAEQPPTPQPSPTDDGGTDDGGTDDGGTDDGGTDG